jgi:hypothetical protein
MQVDDAPAVTPPILTDHARGRAQVRGIPMRIVEASLWQHDHHGVACSQFKRASLSAAKGRKTSPAASWHP